MKSKPNKTRRSKYEKETIILFNEGEDDANIYTFNAALIKRLSTFAQKYPDLCKLERTYDQGGVSYVLEKSRVSVRLIAPYSEERRLQASQHGKAHGFGTI